MFVSIIISTKNEEKNIEKCLKSVVGQSFPAENMEIVVVDNSSADRTKQIVNNFGNGLAPLNLKVFNGGPERSAQKNFGVQVSKGEYFLHLDADMTLGESVLKECAHKVSADKNIVALYIPEIVLGEKYFSKVRRFERSFYNGTAIDAVRFIKKDKFLEAGGFDEKLYAAEDWDLDKRLRNIGRVELLQGPPCPAPQNTQNKNLWCGIYHNESEFNLKKYLKKKAYYSKNLDAYITKWGKNNPDIKKQFGFSYRFLGVFVENGKWKKLLRHPLLALGMYFLRFLVGVRYIIR